MAQTIRYRKPQMTNLPKDVGEKIFKMILSSQAPDLQKMHERSLELEQQMMEERKKHKDEDN